MSSGYFPAGSSVLRAVHSERAVGLNYGQRALMLGAAHPVNFVGTQANTRSGARPFLRLAHTAKAFETIFFGSRAEADRVLAFVGSSTGGSPASSTATSGPGPPVPLHGLRPRANVVDGGGRSPTPPRRSTRPSSGG